MREIKFKLWDKDYNKFDEYHVNRISVSEFESDWVNKRFVKCQFTGLLDKNGKEIYEGDIFKTPMGFIGKIKFGKKIYKTKTDHYECNGWLFERISDKHTETLDSEILIGIVIGNVFDNPELLTTNQ